MVVPKTSNMLHVELLPCLLQKTICGRFALVGWWFRVVEQGSTLLKRMLVGRLVLKQAKFQKVVVTRLRRSLPLFDGMNIFSCWVRVGRG